MDEPDVSNFSTSSSHRLPTISASQALQDAASRSRIIVSNLPKLDEAFRSENTTPNSPTGLPRGQVTELYGPPGVGKTAFGMQLACNTLHAGERVVWIDTGAPMPGPRFTDMLNSYSIFPSGQDLPSSPPIAKPTAQDPLENLTHFNVHTLPHLLVLFLHPTAKFPPEKTVLIVIDNVSAPFATAFPRSSDARMSILDLARKTKLQWAANRKWAVAGDLAAAMNKMAALKDIAVLVINQVATSLKGVRRAVLKPAITGAAWEAAIHNRVVMWRDFALVGSTLDQPTALASGMRFVGVVKAGGKVRTVNAENAVPFVIGKAGLQEINLTLFSPALVLAKQPPPIILEPATATATAIITSTKRKADEIADSDEDGVELGSDDDFALPDEEEEDLFHGAVLDEGGTQ